MEYFEKLIYVLSRWCDRVAQGAVIIMMLLLSTNIALRFFGKSILGTYDWTGLTGTIVIALALGQCGIQRGHVRVEFVMMLLPNRVQAVVDTITGILSLGLFTLAAWQSVVLGSEMWGKGDVSMTAQTPFHPFVYTIAFGCVLLWLVICIQTIKALRTAVRG